MAVNRYLSLTNGVTTMVVPATASGGSADGGRLIALNASGQLDTTMLPSGVGATTIAAVPSAAISAGMLVNFYQNGGVLAVRPADSTAAGSEANGYAPSAVASGVSGNFNIAGLVNGLSGLTIGSTYFLGTVGAVTSTAPSTAGNIVQQVGKAISATSLEFNQGTPVTVA